MADFNLNGQEQMSKSAHDEYGRLIVVIDGSTAIDLGEIEVNTQQIEDLLAITNTRLTDIVAIDYATETTAEDSRDRLVEIRNLIDAQASLAETQPVSGPLTDAQLRAVAVPVSGFPSVYNPTTPTTVRNGQKLVAVTNTAIQLDAGACVGVVVQALAANAGNVVIGDSGASTVNGFQLQPGQATGVAIDNVNRLYVNGTAGDGVCWVGS